MSGILDILDHINNISRQISQEIKGILYDLKIRLSVEDFMLLYRIYQHKKKDESMSPQKLAQQWQYVIQQVIYQVKSLESRKYIDLDNGEMITANRDISICKYHILEQVFIKVEQELKKKKLNLNMKV